MWLYSGIHELIANEFVFFYSHDNINNGNDWWVSQVNYKCIFTQNITNKKQYYES